MKKEVVGTKEKNIQNTIIALLACILYEPEKIAWTETQRIALYLYKNQNLGPKGTNTVALCMYQLYEKAKNLRPSLTYDKNNIPLSLKKLIDIEYFKLEEIYQKISKDIDNKKISSHLRKKAEEVLDDAKNMIDANEIVIKGPRYDVGSYTEYLYNNLVAEVKEKTESNTKKIYGLTIMLFKELNKNKEALEGNFKEEVMPVKPINNVFDEAQQELNVKALILIEELARRMENEDNLAKYYFYKDCIEELEEALEEKNQVLEKVKLVERYFSQLKR